MFTGSPLNTVVHSTKCKIVIAYVHVGLKGLQVKYLLNIFTTDCQRHTVEMAVVETLWQLHTLTVLNSWLNLPNLFAAM